MASPKIVVLGAGVSGLTTALELKKNLQNVSITVAGQYLPGDMDVTYTSPFAGANWHTFSEDDDYELQEFDKPGYFKFLELANEPKSGVWIKKSFAYLTNESFEESGRDPSKFFKWYRNFVQDFEIIDSKDLPDGIALGFLFKGVVITVPIYLNYLLSNCLDAGIDIKRTKRLASVQQAKNMFDADYVINCTGLLATKLGGFNDPNRNYPVKGQVVHVSNNARYKMSVSMFAPDYPDELFYIMPRKEGGCIIGGCVSQNVEHLDEDKGLTQRIIQRALKYVPELVDDNFQGNAKHIDIIKVNVGLRPAREGGVRVEQDSQHEWLYHNYGAGGGGYQGSFGFSAKIVKLIQKKIRGFTNL